MDGDVGAIYLKKTDFDCGQITLQMSHPTNGVTACNCQNCLSSTGALVTLRIVKYALLPKIRLFERSEFSNFGQRT